MKNYNNSVNERIEQAHDARIDKLFWIAASTGSDELAEFLNEDLDDENWEELFPELVENENYEEYKEDGELITMLIDNDKLGFLARVSIPRCYNFRYDGENISNYSSNQGHRRLRYIYAESPEELITAIEIVADEVFEDYKAIDLKEKSKQTKP
ncbi:MAG: hypothetical protein A2066_12990 [Bacteroidetes bacterium GWB2_41_8]|nr:MAG: hypothetical protein A2066_12990 [Bacteroidetes bacterium GWB2_41_8]